MKFIVAVVLALAVSAKASYPAPEPIVYHEEPRPIVYALQHEEIPQSYSHVYQHSVILKHAAPAPTVIVPQIEYRAAPVITKVIEQPAPVITKVIEQPHLEYGLPAVAETRFAAPLAAPHTSYGVPTW